VKHIDVFTLVPGAFSWFTAQHPVSTALASGVLDIKVHDTRSFSTLSHHEVDDTPYGGGPGMVGRVDVVANALEQVFGIPAEELRSHRDVFVLSAGGRPFDHAFCLEVARKERDLVLLCGRFEGMDARVEKLFATGSLSIGPYVLAGGEVAALAVIEALVRHLPGSLGNTESTVQESFSEELEGMVEYPQYTRPRSFRGEEVPAVLLSGDHAAVARWRCENARPSPWAERR
jgi:tRNA (guanine37-N1)-methyltransferase